MSTQVAERTELTTEQAARGREWLAADKAHYSSIIAVLDAKTAQERYDTTSAQHEAAANLAHKTRLLYIECREDESCIIEAKRAAYDTKGLAKS